MQGYQYRYYTSCGKCYYHLYKGDKGLDGYEVAKNDEDTAIEVSVTSIVHRVITGPRGRMVHVGLMAIQEPEVPMEKMEKMVIQDQLVHEVTQDTATTDKESQDLLEDPENVDQRCVNLLYTIFVTILQF